MNNGFTKLFIFVAGASIGALVAWKFAEEKYKRIAQEEIDSVKEVFSNREKTESRPIETRTHIESKPDLMEYAKVINESGYTSYSDGNTQTPEKVKVITVPADMPFIISPDEFDEVYGYETETLWYYADGVLTDEFGEIMDDDEIEEAVTKDALNHFGEYEEDSVFVRNDARSKDYEILKDMRVYSERNNQ